MSVQEERLYWDKASTDPDVDSRFIAASDVASVDSCLAALAPVIDVVKTNRNKAINILDIGCGVGRLAIPIAEKYPNSMVMGIDISIGMLRISIERAGTALVNFGTELCNGRTIPYPDAIFDAAYSVLTFQHVPTVAKRIYVNETARVLRKGGVFRFQFVEDAEFGLVSYGISKNEIRAMCERAGFTIKQIDTGIILPNWTWVTAVKQ
jgi:ubiquinone/menaquinone biosynthesis C-methylase UbiE